MSTDVAVAVVMLRQLAAEVERMAARMDAAGIEESARVALSALYLAGIADDLARRCGVALTLGGGTA